MDSPLVSVIMCTYNRKQYVARAIDSVIAQRRDFPIEIIIGDDCSSDGTRDVITEYQEKYPEIIVLNFQKENQGVGANWASSVKMARGKYLAMLDDDDYWCDNNRLIDAVMFLEDNEEYGVVHTGYYRETDDGKRVRNHYEDIPASDLQRRIISGKGNMFFPTFICRRQLILDNIILDDFIRLRFSLQDWPVQVLIADKTKYKYFSTPSYAYRVVGTSITRPKTYEQLLNKFSRDKVLYQYLDEKLPGIMPFELCGWDSYVADRMLSLAYRKQDFGTARKYALECDGKKLKTRCAKHRITFYALCLCSKIKKAIS